MRLLLIWAIVVAAGLAITLLALQNTPTPELAAAGTPQQVAQEALPQETAPETSASEPTVTLQPQTPATAAPSATRTACLALEVRLVEDLDNANEQLKEANDDYADAEESYDDALSSKFQDETYLQQLRDERSEAREAQDAAEGDYNLVLKRLSKTRQECGLFR